MRYAHVVSPERKQRVKHYLATVCGWRMSAHTSPKLCLITKFTAEWLHGQNHALQIVTLTVTTLEEGEEWSNVINLLDYREVSMKIDMRTTSKRWLNFNKQFADGAAGWRSIEFWAAELKNALKL